jgi:hypothetical protein
VSLLGAGPVFAGALVDGDVVVDEPLDSLDFESLVVLAGSLDALSAFAAFLYESLR